MICPNCGAELPDGSTWCAACGNAIEAQPMMGGAANNLFSGAPVAAPAPAKKSAGPIIAIIAAIVAVAAIVVVAVLFLGGGKYNGTYKLSEVSAYGMTFTVEQFEAMAGAKIDMTLTVKGNKCDIQSNMPELNVTGGGTAKIKIKGSEVTITDGKDTIKGTYDSKAKTIALYEETSGVTMTFKKQ